MKNSLNVAGLIYIVLMTTGTLSAQIPGTYFAAVDDADGNTVTVDGNFFADGGNVDWLDISGGPGSFNDDGMLTGGIFEGNDDPNGGFQIGNPGDSNIVSTFSGPGLEPNGQYTVYLIWQYVIFVSSQPPLFAGVTENPTFQLPARDDVADEGGIELIETPLGSIYTARAVLLPEPATANADGEIQLYISHEIPGNLNMGAYSGAAFVKTTGGLLGDVNCDGNVDLLDVAPFVALITSGDFEAKGDINDDGVVDLLDVGPFVDLLSN